MGVDYVNPRTEPAQGNRSNHAQPTPRYSQIQGVRPKTRFT